METEFRIRKGTENDIRIIEDLAHKTWPFAYKDIITPGQLKYMLQLIYSPEALWKQMNDSHQFLIAEEDQTPVGFASYSYLGNNGLFKLQKLYVLPEFHGKGLGKELLDFVIKDVRSRGARTLRLNMNRGNRAKNFYERNGFKITGEEDIDIGNNYFMNDYVMEKDLVK